MKSVDVDKTSPRDLSDGIGRVACIFIGAVILTAAVIGLFTFDYLKLKREEEMMADQSHPEDPVRINFTFSFPAIPRKFAMDVSDVSGTEKIDLTTNEGKKPMEFDLQKAVAIDEDQEQRESKHNEWEDFDYEEVDITSPIHAEDFERIVNHYPIVLVDFFAPWCPFSQRLAPSWDAAATEIHEKYPESDGRIRLAKVDCIVDTELCREHRILGYPTVRVFRNGRDDVHVTGPRQKHESYIGERTTTAIVAFAESLVPSAGNPHTYHPEM